MEHHDRQQTFFMFYSIAYGVTLGIAFASDMLSMYFFYELLTLSTVPLSPTTSINCAPLKKYTFSSPAALASR